jgi:hypothetical protein
MPLGLYYCPPGCGFSPRKCSSNQFEILASLCEQRPFDKPAKNKNPPDWKSGGRINQ